MNDTEGVQKVGFDGVLYPDGRQARVMASLQSGRVHLQVRSDGESISGFSILEADIRNFLERSGGEQTDLRRLYPAVASEVDARMASDKSDKTPRAMSFRVNVRASNNKLLRYRGKPQFLQTILETVGIKAETKARSNGEWVEYSEVAVPGSFQLVDREVNVFRFPWCSYALIYRTVDGFKSADQFYINGKEVPFEDAFGSNKRVRPGDVVVAIGRGNDIDNTDFLGMPVITVYKSTWVQIGSEFCFAFQASGLTQSPVDVLIPLTSSVLGGEIASIEINGRDVDRNLYSRRIRRGDNVRVVVKCHS